MKGGDGRARDFDDDSLSSIIHHRVVGDVFENRMNFSETRRIPNESVVSHEYS